MAEANVRLRVDGRDAVNQLNRVNKAAGTLQGTVGKLVGAFAGIQAAKFVFFKTAELETQTRSLKVLTGSLGNAQKIIKELQQFGAVTPFTSSELIETAKRLKAFGFETEKSLMSPRGWVILLALQVLTLGVLLLRLVRFRPRAGCRAKSCCSCKSVA